MFGQNQNGQQQVKFLQNSSKNHHYSTQSKLMADTSADILGFENYNRMYQNNLV